MTRWVAAYIAGHLARSTDRLESSELAWFRTGAPSDELNGVLRFADEAAIDAALEEFEHVPTLWHVWPGITPVSMEAALEARGLRLVEEEPLMSRSMVDVPEYEFGPQIVEATTVAQVGDMVCIWLGEEEGDRNRSIVDALTQFPFGPNESRHFLLYEEHGRPVGCANVFVVDGIASIENIVTTAGYRNQGIGTAMTKAALRVAARDGANHALLTASPQGERIYRSLGFETVGAVRRYS